MFQEGPLKMMARTIVQSVLAVILISLVGLSGEHRRPRLLLSWL